MASLTLGTGLHMGNVGLVIWGIPIKRTSVVRWAVSARRCLKK